MVIGNLFLMNLFLAILLKNFEDKKGNNNEAEDEDKEENPVVQNESLISSMKIKLRRVFLKRDKPAPIEFLNQHSDYVSQPKDFELNCSKENSCSSSDDKKDSQENRSLAENGP